MTGDLRSKTVAAIEAEGMSVLVKPFSADQLFQEIERLCPPSGVSARN
jgi:DNA-binding NtrC family response regulator